MGSILQQREEFTVSTGKFVIDYFSRPNGLKETVSFIPDPAACPTSGRIRLIQSVRAFALDGVSDFRDWPLKMQNVNWMKTPVFWFVDHDASKWFQGNINASVFYLDSWRLNNTHDGANQNQIAMASSLYDEPGGAKIGGMEFEAAARDADPGSPTFNQYFGSARWAFTRGPNTWGVFQHVGSDDVPSQNLIESVQMFNQFYGTNF